MLSAFDPILIIAVVALGVLVVWDYIGLFFFIRKVNDTYRRVSIDKSNVSRYLPKTDLLLQKYKLVPNKNLKLLKLELESTEYNNTLISQMLDFFHKLIITISIAAVTVVTTISVATLAFLKDNNVLQKDQSAWIKNVQDNLNNFSKGVNFYVQLLFAGLIVFAVFSLHSQVLDSKNKYKKKHLRYIDEALKED